jgi:deazaflavin-dependent oxidoreductase (nitroreductase family)
VDADVAALPFCHITTTGRVTGRPHRIEIWFALNGGVLYVLAGDGERSDTVRNLVADPRVTLELGPDRRSTTGRVVQAGTDEDALARRLLVAKYQPGYEEDLTDWGRSSLPVAFEWASSS